jgi:tetratricopeptide (TPR) repeat protein
VSFVVDDFAAWLIGLFADAGRRKLTSFLLGTEQERALRRVAAMAVLTAHEIRATDAEAADELAMVISQVFVEPAPYSAQGSHTTILEALREGIGKQLAILDDVNRTGTGQSSSTILGVSTSSLTEKLTGHLVRQIIVEGSRGSSLEPLAAQLNHDATHLQVHQLAHMFGQLSEQVATALTRFAPGPRPSSALAVRYSLPPDAPQFTGREDELDRIQSAVTDAERTGASLGIYTIEGMPGIGKTALAVHAAHLLRHHFPDWQLYLNLRAHTPDQNPVAPGAALAGLLRMLGINPRDLPASMDERTALWRDRMAGQRSLLVLDNAASSAQISPLLPGSNRCLVLVTSRRNLGDLQGEVIPILLQVLKPTEAQEMFARLASRLDTSASEAVPELMMIAGYLPLAISLLARVYARRPSWTMADLIAETKTNMLTLKVEDASVGAAFAVSYRCLIQSLQEFFRRLALHLGTTIDAYAAAALAGTSVTNASDSLDTLLREGLLTEVGYHRYGMHDLIRRYVSERADDPPAVHSQQAVARLLDYYQSAGGLARNLLLHKTSGNSTGLNAASTEVPQLADTDQALVWARIERANLVACLDHATRTGQHARAIAFTAAMASLWRRDGPWVDAIEHHLYAVQAAERLGDRSEQARALIDLAIVRRLTGDYVSAAQALEVALRICRELGDRPGLASGLSELGAVHYMTDDYAAAMQALRDALSVFRDIGDRAGQAYALSYTGLVQQITGDYSNAVLALEEALGISSELGDQLGQASALGPLGVTRQLTGDYVGAAEALEKSLGISRDLGDRLGEAYALVELGIVRRLIGDYRGAAQVLEEALANARETDHPVGQIGPLTYLGVLRQDLGDYPGAAQALEEALAISAELGDRVGRAYALSYKGALCRLTGDYSVAEDALEEALSISRALGAQDSEIVALNETGMLRTERGDLKSARECHLAALNLAQQASSSWDEARALAGLGLCALAVGDTADATKNLQRAKQIFERIGAAEAASVATELEAIGADGSPTQDSA